MSIERIEREIIRAIAQRARVGDSRVQNSIHVVTNIAKKCWVELLQLIKEGGKREEVKHAAKTILQRMVDNSTRIIEPLLNDVIGWGFNSAFEVWENHLPAEYWKLAFADDPFVVLMESVEFRFPEPGGSGPTSSTRGKFTKKRSAIDKIQGSRRKYKPSTANPTPTGKTKPPIKLKKTRKVSPASAAKVKAKFKPTPSETLKIIRSRGWKKRMEKWSKQITDHDRVAELIADGVDRGLKFETIVNRVKPHVHNFAASARRIVRTETARIENELLEKTFEAFAEIIDGYQIINPLDERTRPKHAVRAGRIYWKDKRKKPNAEDRPALPDAPNCRCTYAPVLNAPAPKELRDGPRVDTRTYAGFFNKLTNKEKEKIVGPRRWELMKKNAKKPSWWDAIDPKTGRFISETKHARETPKGTLSRRKKVQAKVQRDITAVRKSLKYYRPTKREK